jgi:enoyl-CoA hydratase/carnithine racemase
VAQFQHITYEVDDDGVALITLDRPDQLNAVDMPMAQSLAGALDEIDADPGVRVVVLTGAGRGFCAGADLSIGAAAFAPRPEQGRASGPNRDWGGVLALRLFHLTKPVVVAINGAAVGLGATMLLPCDIRLASTTARFGFVFTRRGIVTDGCASWFLPRVVGISTALRWCLGGDLIPADEALSAGLVSSVHEPDDLVPAALAVARGMAANTSAVSVSLTRQLLWRGLTEDHPMGSHRWESRAIEITSRGPDAREGVASFLEKRPAAFAGRVPGDLPDDWPFWEEPVFDQG